ncbi:unnamed protein product [Adineta ricciae]|uniref:Uncharacterized protein n=1 Tax=Adineta ricciae TaxID=249248 RepID=A0A814VZD6_ADIRI|nr:unnamed protein product [Adineta ricciae]
MISSSVTILLIIIDVTLPMVIPFSIHPSSTHLLHIRVRNTSIETIVNDKQLNFIEKQLRQKQIPYKRVETNPVNIVIIVGPFPKLAHTSLNLTKPVTLKSDLNQGRPTSDQESYNFRHCLETCEIYQDAEFKPDHNCIRNKCLQDITGI